MRRRIAIFFVAAILCSIFPNVKVYSDADSELSEYLRTLTPELVLKKANEDMKELYGITPHWYKR